MYKRINHFLNTSDTVLPSLSFTTTFTSSTSSGVKVTPVKNETSTYGLIVNFMVVGPTLESGTPSFKTSFGVVPVVPGVTSTLNKSPVDMSASLIIVSEHTGVVVPKVETTGVLPRAVVGPVVMAPVDVVLDGTGAVVEVPCVDTAGEVVVGIGVVVPSVINLELSKITYTVV